MPNRCAVLCLWLVPCGSMAGCFEPNEPIDIENEPEDPDDGDPPGADEDGKADDPSCPVACEDGSCCGAGTVCVADGCCPEETPFYCGAQICGGSESACPYYGGPCIANNECLVDESCLGAGDTGLTVCAPACGSDADCPMPSDGGAVPVCGSTGDDELRCFLFCDEASRSCPTGMHCWIEAEATSGLCLWMP